MPAYPGAPYRWSHKPSFGSHLDVAHPLARSLQGLWLFNGPTGSTAYDITPYRRNLTLGSTASRWFQPFPLGHCLQTDGTVNGGASLASLSLAAEWTLEAWVVTSSVTGNIRAVCRLNGTTAAALYLWSNNQWAVFNSFGATFSGATVTAGNVYHIVGVNSALTNNTTLYVNGVPTGTHTAGTTVGTGGFTVGVDTFSQYLNGWIGKVAVYNRALTAAEVARLYTNPFAAVQPPPRGLMIASGVTPTAPPVEGALLTDPGVYAILTDPGVYALLTDPGNLQVLNGG